MKRTLTRRIAYSKQFDFLVGIDLGKKRNVAIIIDQQLKQHGRFQFGHRREGYEQLAAWLSQKSQEESGRILIGMEPTNDYWQWLATYLEAQGQPYRLVNSFTVKKSREGSQLDYAKDDWRDGLTIARLLREGQYRETQLLGETYAQLRQYEQAHWQVGQEIRRHKTLLRPYAERLFPELREVFKAFTGKTAWALLQNHADPQVIAKLSWEAFEAAVGQEFNGRRLMVKKLRQVYELAPSSIGVQPGAALQRLIGQQRATLSLQQQQLQELETALLACFHSLPSAPYLLSLGLGEVATALIAAEIGDLRHFTAAKQLVKLAGIQPTPNQSGQYRRQKTGMSHKGRPRLRTYLFFATLRLIRWDAAFQTRQQRLLNRQSKPLKKLEAVGVLMNKLLHLIWSLCRQEKRYSPVHFAAA